MLPRKSHLSFLLAVLIAILGSEALAESFNTFSLDFSGLQDQEEVLNYYNGGFGSKGSGPGPLLGITFTPEFLAIAATNPYGDLANIGFLNGNSAIMNVLNGFTGTLDFYYQAFDASGSVTIWSGLNGTGIELGSVSVPSTSGEWSSSNTLFDGLAMSVVFSGNPGSLTFDYINDNSEPMIPEPSCLILLGTGLAGLTIRLRRRVG